MCIYRFYGGQRIRSWYKFRYGGRSEPVSKKAKVANEEDELDDLPKNETIPSTFDPVTYLTSKVNSIKLQKAHRDLKMASPDFDGYIWHRGNCADWATTVREAPVGSILRKKQNLFSETQTGQVGEFVQEHFVKTAHLQSLLEKLDKAVENKERCSHFMHGISGVGKTYALDALHCYALEKGLFVIHMKSGSYENIWRYDLRKISWELLFLREILNSRSMPKLREYFDLPPKPKPKEERKGREEECEDILEKIDKIITDTKMPAQAKNYIASQYFRKFWGQLLTDDDDIEDGREKKMVCIIFDDINALSKGYTKLNRDIMTHELTHHKRIGANILGLLDMDQSKSTHKIARAKNAILFCAASQHYKGSSTVSNQEGFRRINPPTSVPELYGFSAYFMSALTRRKLRDLTYDQVLKCLITGTGMVARLIVRSIGGAHGQSANLNDLSGDQARAIIDIYAEAVRSQIARAIQNRYAEVFCSFHEAQNKNLAVMGVKPGNNRMKDTHGELVRITSDVYNLNIFQLKRCNPATANVSDDDNPYLDAGLIVESPLKPTFYGFVSRFAKIEFAREMYNQHAVYGFHAYLKDSSDNRAFEQRVTTTLMFGGYDGALHRYKGGAQVVGLPKIPAPSFIMTLSFDYTGANVAKKTLSAVSFCDTNGDTSTGASSSVRDYKIWMNDNHNFTQSILLVSKPPETGSGGVQMPAFDQISIVKEVTPARRCTYMFLFQTTMEQPTDATIPAARFGKFEKNGLKILQKLVQHAFGDGYEIQKKPRTESSEPNFEVHKPAGTRVPNFEIRIVYVSMKKQCMTSGNSDLEVLVVPYDDVIKKFGIVDELFKKK